MDFSLENHVAARNPKRQSPYVLGSIWKRRDGQTAVVISREHACQVRVITTGHDDPEPPYLIGTDNGKVFLNDRTDRRDLIYRDED